MIDLALHLSDDLFARAHLRYRRVRADDSRIRGCPFDLRIGVHATLSQDVHAGLGGADRGTSDRAGHIAVHDKIAVGIDIPVIVVTRLEGGVNRRVIELMQPSSRPR